MPKHRRRLTTSAWLALLVLAVTGFGFLASRSAAPPEQGPPTGDVAAAQRAVEALLEPESSATALELLPADFTEVTGVAPGRAVARDGTVRAVHVDGGCSTPWGDDDTRWDYGTPCKSHDLGYDLLRYAEQKGHPLAPEFRAALDHRLSADMHGTCESNPQNSGRLCSAVASLYTAGLDVNSWHQRWGPPVGEPIAPMLAGVAAIGFLLTFRLRGWLTAWRTRPARAAPVSAPATTPPRGGRWALLAAGSITLLVLGDAGVSLARWAGAGDGWLWPLTWLTQLAFVFFFAGGHANVAGWRSVLRGGGGYREYLAHRTSWLLRLTLVFAVVAFAVPLALELLGVPEGTAAEVVRIALHPLWLLGLYVLTVVATPAMHALHRRSRLAGVGSAGTLLGAAELSANLLDSPVPHYAAALALALFAQQLAFVHADGRRPSTALLSAVTAIGLGGLVAGAATGGVPLTLLGTPGTLPALAAPTVPVLLLGVVHLGLLTLLREPLGRLARRPAVLRGTGLATRAPMSLYLGFLAAMCLLVALVYLPGRLTAGGDWLLRPQSLLATALLAVPAALVFWWFERHLGHHPVPRNAPPSVPDRLHRPLAHAAVAIGIGYATVGVFGLALTSFTGTDVLGLALDPIQSLVHLLLGMSLLHTVRIGASAAPSTWLLTALACVPPLLSGAAQPDPFALSVVAHGATALFAVAAMLVTSVISWSGGRMALGAAR